MSTIVLDTITGKSTSTTVTIGSTPVVSASANSMTIRGEGSNQTSIQQGLAKCWGDYDQDNTAVRDSFNNSSVTDTSAGNYDPQWTTSMGSVNYTTMSATQPQSTAAGCESFEDEGYKTTGDTRIQTIENDSATDHANNGWAVFGDLA